MVRTRINPTHFDKEQIVGDKILCLKRIEVCDYEHGTPCPFSVPWKLWNKSVS